MSLRTSALTPAEEIYREARKAGVLFMRYDLIESRWSQRAAIRLGSTSWITSWGVDRNRPDLIVLASAILPRITDRLPRCTSFPQRGRLFHGGHAKLRPLNLQRKRVRSGARPLPQAIEESIAQAKAAASRASVVLSKDLITPRAWSRTSTR